MAWAPPSSPVITVSATHEASDAATAASAALPPSARISAPAAAVAGCPAAQAGLIRPAAQAALMWLRSLRRDPRHREPPDARGALAREVEPVAHQPPARVAV